MSNFAEVAIPADVVALREKAPDEAAILVSEFGENLIAVVKSPKVFIPMFELPSSCSCSIYETQLREAAAQFGGPLPIHYEGSTYEGLMYVQPAHGTLHYGFLVLVKAEALNILRPSQYPETDQSDRRIHLNTLERF